MARTLKGIQNAFTTGELSPLMIGRSDIQKYGQGLKTLRDWIILPYGGVRTRDGLHFVNEVKDSTRLGRIVPFEFSTVQAYVLEFGNLYFRIYKDGGRIESPPSTPVEVVAPYADTNLSTIQYVQTADVLYLFHPTFAPRKITRTSHTSWTITVVDWIDGPYLAQNTTATTITPSATTGNGITLTASTAIFQAGHVGSLWRLTHGGTTGYVKVTAFTDTTHVTADVKKTLGGTTATTLWSEGAWSDVRGWPTAPGFFQQRLWAGGTTNDPQTIWGSVSNDFENMTPGTGASDAVSFKLADTKVNAIRWISQARGLVVGTVGNEFSASGSGSSDTAITPTSISVKSQTTYGSVAVQPVRVAHNIMFVQRAGKKFYQLSYNFDQDAYLAPDLTLMAEHILGLSGVSYMAQAPEPFGLVWVVRSDGTLASLTYLELQQISGWATHTTDGLFESVAVIPTSGYDQTWFLVNRTINGVTKRYIEYMDTAYSLDCFLTYDGTVTGATVTPGAVSGTTITFTASVPTFSAADVGKHIWAIGSGLTGRAVIKTFTDTTHVVCDIYVNFTNTNPIAASSWAIAVSGVTGLSHLEGKTVGIVGNDAEFPDDVVTGGEVVLTGGVAYKIAVGLKYTPTLVTLPVEIPLPDGTSQGRKVRWVSPQARLYQTRGLRVNNNELLFRSAADAMGNAVPAFTGVKPISITGMTEDSPITITQTHPFSATLLSIYGVVEVGDI